LEALLKKELELKEKLRERKVALLEATDKLVLETKDKFIEAKDKLVLETKDKLMEKLSEINLLKSSPPSKDDSKK